MKGLLIKDIYLMKRQARFLAIVVLMGVIYMMTSDDAQFAISYITFIVSMFTVSTMSYDEYDNGMSFLMVLSSKRRDYVREKYIFAVIMNLCAWGISMLFALGVSFGKNLQMDAIEFVKNNAPILVMVMLMMTIMIPVQLKFGVDRRRVALVIVLVCVFAVVYAGGMAVKMFFSKELIQNVISIMNQNNGIIIAAAVMLGILIFAVSYCISVKIIEKKEF